jgi:uncharacterized protein YecT (DUF1311 family)
MRLFLATAACVGAMLATQARADGCADPSTQVTMNACAAQAFQRADADLNATYKQIASRLKSDASTAKLMVNAQKSWLAFRDAECEFSTSGAVQGSIYPMLVAQCRTRLSIARCAELKAYLHCEDGDPSCPVPSG